MKEREVHWELNVTMPPGRPGWGQCYSGVSGAGKELNVGETEGQDREFLTDSHPLPSRSLISGNDLYPHRCLSFKSKSSTTANEY